MTIPAAKLDPYIQGLARRPQISRWSESLSFVA
jgi:hypothetical protein